MSSFEAVWSVHLLQDLALQMFNAFLVLQIQWITSPRVQSEAFIRCHFDQSKRKNPHTLCFFRFREENVRMVCSYSFLGPQAADNFWCMERRRRIDFHQHYYFRRGRAYSRDSLDKNCQFCPNFRARWTCYFSDQSVRSTFCFQKRPLQ